LRNSNPKIRVSAFLLRAIFAAMLVAALSFAPVRVAGQAPSTGLAANAGQPANAGQANSTSAGAPADNSATPPAHKEEAEQEHELLHAPAVQSLARMLHLNLDTTIFLLLGINFAIIFFAVAIPLARIMPKIIRKRSQTLSQDLETARAATADAQSRLSAVEAKLAGLGEEMQKFRNQVEQDSLEDEKRIKAALSEESARIVAAAEQEIGVAAAQIRRGLRDFAANLAIEQATKQLKMTPETDRALIAEFVAGVGADAAGKGGRN
jgi:F-type H+-transporting ATPase subunit b